MGFLIVALGCLIDIAVMLNITLTDFFYSFPELFYKSWINTLLHNTLKLFKYSSKIRALLQIPPLQRVLRSIYSPHNRPAETTIRRLVKKFESTGSVADHNVLTQQQSRIYKI